MKLDPKESINNMGHVRVDVLDASDLPAADRNGFSDPYCKFILNGKEVFKSAEQKKTLNPVWRQYFEIAVPSRIGADFRVMVYDADTLGNDDVLGGATIDLSLMEPMRPREYKLPLDGKSGVVRLRALFRPEYVTRARQGSSTFSGSLGPAKAMTGLVNAPMKGASMVGGGVSKGASFFKSSKRKEKDSEAAEAASAASALAATMYAKRLTITQQPPAVNGEVPQGSPPPLVSQASSSEPKTPSSSVPHGRSTSFSGRSGASVSGGKPGGPEMGTATFTIMEANDYSPDAKVRIQVRQLTPKGAKDVHKTKSIQPSSGAVKYDNETFKVHCTPDTQFQIAVTNHSAFRNLGLGEAMFFIDDSSTGGSEKVVKAGTGTVLLRTSFTPGGTPGRESSNSSGRSNPFRNSVLNRSPTVQS